MKINRSVRFGIGIMAIAFAATACGGGEENKSITESATALSPSASSSISPASVTQP